jgi:hypothetical protein
MIRTSDIVDRGRNKSSLLKWPNRELLRRFSAGGRWPSRLISDLLAGTRTFLGLSCRAYIYRERTRWCPRCERETIHWRETSVAPGRWLGPIGGLIWMTELVTCSWYCRRCTREIHLDSTRNPGHQPDEN